MIKLEWDEDWLPPADLKEVIEREVRIDIEKNLDDLEQPSDLILHHVPLGKTWEDALVFVYGKDGSDAFHCRYDPTPEWGPANLENPQSPPTPDAQHLDIATVVNQTGLPIQIAGAPPETKTDSEPSPLPTASHPETENPDEHN